MNKNIKRLRNELNLGEIKKVWDIVKYLSSEKDFKDLKKALNSLANQDSFKSEFLKMEGDK